MPLLVVFLECLKAEAGRLFLLITPRPIHNRFNGVVIPT